MALPVGINVLRNDARAALAIAAVTGASFIRVNVLSGVAATDYEFCELPPAILSGRVFQDGDTLKTDDGQPPSDLASVRDGVYSSDDLPIADVLL
ncbi:MAG TPA: BtpA/SgcQ family protein, partial [Microthrixaceae bacterium]|nr:BtpA/SgcQ family protein [Microthrixaceae bacterium]